jgi:hypothetical protein
MATRTQHEPVLLQLPCVFDQVRLTCGISVQQRAGQAVWQFLSLGTHPDRAPCFAAPAYRACLTQGRSVSFRGTQLAVQRVRSSAECRALSG